MKRLVWGLCIVLVLASVALANPPGHSKAFGKTLGEWMVGWFERYIGETDAGGDENVVYLDPPVDFVWDEDSATLFGESDVTLKPGDAFTYPIFFVWGEEYDDGSVDDPDDPSWPDEWFTGAGVLVTVDGKTVIDSEDDDLDDYFFGPEYFDETIWYDEATWYGATGAIWIKGIGFVHTPLSKGDHVLRIQLYVVPWGVTFDDTWNITVTK